MPAINYAPPKTVDEFIYSDAFANFIVGPVGSGKTTGMLFKLARIAMEQRRGPSGLRKSRMVIVRNTANQLSDTTKKSWDTWFPEGAWGGYERTQKTFNLTFDDVRCEVLFRPLDTPDDVRRLLSLEANAICFDEFREIHSDIYAAATGRVGRYPAKKDGGPVKDNGEPNFGIFGASNCPVQDSFWGETLVEPPDNMKVFWQPSGLGEDAENLANLPPDYYTTICDGRDEDWINVYVHGKLGRSLAGKPVWPAFNSDYHVAKNELRPIGMASSPLIVGLDFGLTPAASFNQLDPLGRFLTFDELTADGMGILRFTREKMKPLMARRFPGMQVLIIGDPAGAQRAQTDERSAFDILRQEGLRVIPARTNSILARINSVDKLLTRQIDGKPGHLIDPRCKQLITAMRGGYRFKLKTNQEYDVTPEKNVHSHIADAHQYAALHADGSAQGGMISTGRREVKQVSSRGWT